MTSNERSPFDYLRTFRKLLQIHTWLVQHVLLGNSKSAVTGAFLVNVMLLVATAHRGLA